MNPETFFDNFGMLADVPDGIKKLRELILQLAVQGKLVAQDENDEPAEKLLEQANNEKISFVKEFRVRKPVPSLTINENEKPHELPRGWKWCRNSDIFALRKGKKPKNLSESKIGLPYLDIAALDRNVITRFTDDISCPNSKEGDLIIVCDGSRSGLVLTGKNGVLGSTLSVIHHFAIDKYYLRVLLLRFYNEMNSEKKGAAIPHLDIARMYSQIIGLPPLAEQRRIVARVDQLMTHCDELEVRQKMKHEARTRLNSAALDKLFSAPDGFMKNWQTISDNFDLLYDAPETVGELRKAILQLAVMGKLVAQDENDEPASVLLERIKAEKDRLVKEGKIKKSKVFPSIREDELPYELPLEWEWVRLDNISDIGTGSTPLTTNLEYYNGGSIPWVTSSATSSKFIDNIDKCITEKAVKEYRLRLYPRETLIVALYGQGKTRGQVSELKIEATINQACVSIVFFENFKSIKQYVKLVLDKKYDELRALAAGGAQPNLNVGKIKQTILPLPPLAEQRRIVARVDQLMTLCDELEAKLARQQEDSAGLMEAVVGEMVAG